MKKLLFLLVLHLISSQLSAIDYYWVGGSGNWSDFSNHWATSSGGTTFHTQVPTLNDNVFFDANSFTATGQVVTNDQTIIYCRSMDWNGVNFNPSFSGPSMNELKIYGSLRFVSAMNLTYSGKIYFEATSAGHNITMGGKSFTQYIYFNGLGGSWTLQDAFQSSSWVNLVRGTLNTNNNNLTAGALYASASNPFTLNLGSSLVTLTGSTWAWWINNAQFVLNAGTSIIRLSSSGSPDIRYANNLVFNQVEFTANNTTANIISSSGCTFNSIVFAGNAVVNGSHTINSLSLAAGKTYQFQSGSTQTLNNVLAAGTCSSNLTIKSTTAGTQATFQKSTGSISIAYLQLQDMRATGGATFIASNSIDLGNNLGWNISGPTPRQLYWVGGTGNWSDPNRWALSSGGSGPNCPPNFQDDIFFDQNSFSAAGQTVSIDINASCRNMTWNLVNNPILAGASTNTTRIYGSLSFSPTMTLTYNGEVYFEATSTGKTITMAGKSFSQYIYFNGAGGEWSLLDAFQSSSWVNLVRGTLNTNSNSVNAGAFYASASNPFTLNLGSSLVTLTGSTWAWWINNAQFVLNAGTSTIRLSSTGSPDIRYANNLNFYNVEFTSANTTANIISSSNSTFNQVIFYGNGNINGSHSYNNLQFTAGKLYQFQSNATQTVLNLTASGTCTSNITLKSLTAGTQTTIQKTNGTLNLAYLQLQDMRATGGAQFNVVNAVDLGNNVGWNIQTAAPRQLYWIGGTGNWSDASHWSLSSGGAGPQCPPTFQDDVYFDSNSFSANGQTVTIDANSSCKSMLWANTSTVTLAGPSTNTLRIYGSLTFSPQMNLSYSGEIYFESTSTSNSITMAGKSFNQYIYLNGAGGVWNLQDAFQSNSWVNLVRGTLNTNNYNMTAGAFYASASNPFTLNLGSSLITLTGSTWAWWINNAQFTLNAGTSTVRLSSSGSPDIRYANNLQFYNVEFTNTTTIANIISSSNCYFNNLIFNSDAVINGSHTYGQLQLAAGRTYTLQSGSTQTIVQNLIAQGTGGFPIEIESSTLGSSASFSKASGAICASYLYLKDNTATGGASWTAANSTNNGNVNGWTFGPCVNCTPVQTFVSNSSCGSYTYNNQTYTQSGNYTQIIPGGNGCDTTLSLQLTINQPSSYLLSQSSCQSYLLNGQTYTQSGTYTQIIPNAAGCDSTITLQLTINQPSSSQINRIACNSFTLNNQTYTQSGTYTQTIQNAAGCDSIITLQLTIGQTTTGNIQRTGCDSVRVNQFLYTQSGTYYQNLINSLGCDSLLSIQVTLNHSITQTLTETACGSFTYNNQQITSSGTYTYHYFSLLGCDSIVVLQLTIYPLPQLTSNQPVICQGQSATIQVNGAVQYSWSPSTALSSTTGSQIIASPLKTRVYRVDGTDANGCSAIYTVTVTVSPIPVVDLGPDKAFCRGGINQLDAGVYGSSYLWSNGRTTQQITVTQSGNYSVTVTNAQGCTKSDTVQITFKRCRVVTDIALNRGLNEEDPLVLKDNIDFLTAYPNPFSNQITIEVTDFTAGEKVFVRDALGRVIEEITLEGRTTQLDTMLWPAGMYWLSFEDLNKEPVKMVKIN